MDKDEYIKKLLQANIDQQNKITLLSKKVFDLQKECDRLKERDRLAAEQDARDIRARFPC